MAFPVSPSSRLIPFAMPAAMALAVAALLASGNLWAGLALAGGAVMLGVAAALLSGLIGDLHRLAAYARTLAETKGAGGDGEPAVPELRTGPVRLLAADIMRLNRGWHQRQAGDARR